MYRLLEMNSHLPGTHAQSSFFYALCSGRVLTKAAYSGLEQRDAGGNLIIRLYCYLASVILFSSRFGCTLI